MRERQWCFSVPQKEVWLLTLQGWKRGSWGAGLQQVWRFSAAKRRGKQEVQSTQHERATAKVSRFVTIKDVPPTGRLPETPSVLIAEVVHFLLVRCLAGTGGMGEPPQEPLRLAVCRVYQQRPQEEGVCVAEQGVVLRECAFAVDPLGPVVGTALGGGGKLYGLPYPSLSRLA